jgi:hypothetical protein
MLPGLDASLRQMPGRFLIHVVERKDIADGYCA